MRQQEDGAENELGIAADSANSSLESYFCIFVLGSPPALHLLASLAAAVPT